MLTVESGLVWLHLISDTLIAASYLSIPITLVYFIRKRRDLPFHWMFVCFGIFIVACGATHVMEIWNIWHADYWLAGVVKAVTALASVPTAILLVQLVPKALALPSPNSLEQVNQVLVNRTGDLARANEALQVSEEKFRNLAETASDAIISANALGNIIYFNRAAVRTFGYSSEEVVGKPLTVLMPGRYRDAHRKGLDRFLRTGDARVIGKTVELAGLRKNGVEFPVELSLSTWKTSEGTFFTAILKDITERKKAEEALEKQRNELARSNSELTAVNKELEAFSYSISHDLRAPLRGIDGFSQALLDDYADRLDDTGKQYLQRVRTGAQRMAALIDDLLALSRITRAEIQRQPVDLSQMARAVTQDLARQDSARQVEFVIAKGLQAEADPRLMCTVLENLLGNASKFTSRCSHARIEFGRTLANGLSAFFVRDNGAGFDPAYAARLFGAFQRLHAAAEFPGTGVGLASVQRVIYRHGGRVWAQSAVNQGATFFFTLWADPMANERAETAARIANAVAEHV